MEDSSHPPVPEIESPRSEPDFIAKSDVSLGGSVFLGPEGLRPGWRLVVYLGMAYFLAQILGYVAGFIPLHGNRPLWEIAITQSVLVLAVVLPALVMGRIERRSFGEFGLPLRNAFGRLFWTGVVWGLAAVTALLGVMWGAHVFYFGHLALHGAWVVKFALYWGAFFLLVGFFEEFLFRGYSLFTVANGMGFWPAAVLASLIFGSVHLRNPGENLIGALAAGSIGFFFCFTLRRTGSLWFAVGFHAAWDWGESFLYSVPDSGGMVPGHLLSSSLQGPRWLSGGSVGPEGSVFVFVVVAVTWVVFGRVYRDSH